MKRNVPQAASARPRPPAGASTGTNAAPRATPPVTSPAPSTPQRPWVPAKPKQYRREVSPGPAEMVLEIPGQPISKERARQDPRSGRWYTPQKTQAGEEAVRWHARAAGARVDRHSLFEVDFAFFCGGQRKRDNDNMQKLVQDALNKIVWWDDSQIRRSTVEVVYGSPLPRSVITIRRITSTDAQE